MPPRAQVLLAIALLPLLAAAARGETRADTSPALRAANPDMLSGGLFSAITSNGERRTAALRAGMTSLSKGIPPAVLDVRVGNNVRLGDDPSPLPATQMGQAEPHLVRSPADPRLLLATFQEGRFTDAGALDCGYALSRDGGHTWTRALIPGLTLLSGGPYNRATDPVAAAGPEGELYLNTLGSISGAFARAAVVVSRSTDRGATWSSPSLVYQAPNSQTSPDKNWIAVNTRADSPTGGRVVVTWTNFTSNAAGNSTGNYLVAATSDDRGQTWATPVQITAPGSSNQGTQPLFLPDGSLLVVYISFLSQSDTTQFAIHCKRSVDGGRTFPASATTIVPWVNGWNDPDLREGVFLPSATVATDSGEVDVSYVALVEGTPRVMVTRSVTSGATWTAPVPVSDNPPASSIVNPAITTSADGRTVAVVFMDKRNADDARNFMDLYAAISTDGGATWGTNLRLTDITSDIRNGPPTTRGYMFGDYLAVVPPTTGEPALAVWCDARTGDSDPFAVRFAPTGPPTGSDAYATWALTRGISATPWEDHDADGEQDYFEYLTGTDPRLPEAGDALLVVRSSPTTIDVAWTERANAARLPVVDGIVAVSAAQFATGGFTGAAIETAPLPAEALPTIAPASGLAWRGVRTAALSGIGHVVARVASPTPGTRVVSPSVAAVSTDSRLINVSTRGIAGTGSDQLIVGFVIDAPKDMLVRAAGPALASVGVPDALPAVQLTLTGLPPNTTFSATNANWQQAVTPAAFARVGAFPFAANSSDAALLERLSTGGYTALAMSPTGATGAALVEAYDADPEPGSPTGARLLNLSTRGRVTPASAPLIAGFVVSGTEPRRIVIRAVGPSLAGTGVAEPLDDPTIAVYAGGATRPLATNDDWEISRSGGAVAGTAGRVGAFPLRRASRDAALLLTLAPGPYTAVVSGSGSAGVALVEVYDAD